MLRLFLPMYAVIGSTLAGIAIIAVLVMGFDTLQPIILAAIAGSIVGLPAAWVITKKLMTL